MENAGVVGGNEVFKDVETGSRWQQSSLSRSIRSCSRAGRNGGGCIRTRSF